ncbi:MAG TPA: RDD family protein [Ignavibacteriales bacterium]|nr:RDD family protein [Ignavibacteriales bacterium]
MEEEIQNNNTHKSNHLFDQPDISDLDLAGLAGRWSRLAAAIIDGLILFFPNILAGRFFYGYDAYMKNLKNNSFEFIVSILLIGLIINLILNGYLLYKRGQTLGKVIMDIKIVDMNNKVPSLFNSFFVRSFLFSALYFIPVGQLVITLDPLFIFSANKRCLHDRIAGTKVVDVEITEN